MVSYHKLQRGRQYRPGKDEAMLKQQFLQDVFLNQARRSGVQLTLFLMNGFQIRGVCTGFDNFTVVMNTDGKQQMIYKHAISTIVPAKPVSFMTDAGDD